MEDGGGADDQGRTGTWAALFPHPGEPGEGLKGLSKAHVISQNATEVDSIEVTQKVEPLFLIRAEVGLDGGWSFDVWDAGKVLQFLTEQSHLAFV